MLSCDHAACVWIPLFALRCEEARRPELAQRPVALLAPDNAKRLWQVSPLARRKGVRPGMTVSQAIGACPVLMLCEPDPVHYDQQFARLLTALLHVSPVVEPVELGRVYVGTDGLEGIYGEPERIIEAIQCGMRSAECGIEERPPRMPAHSDRHLPRDSAFQVPQSAFRVGWGRGKFVAWVAASRAYPGQTLIVKPGVEGKFLAAQPVAVLPLDPETHRRLRLLGLRTLGALAALPEDAVVAQFGREGRRAWRLAAGLLVEPVVGRPAPDPVVAEISFFTPLAEREMLARALARLVERALGHPRRIGWRVQMVRARAELEHGASWLAEATLKDPTADRDAILATLTTRLEHAPPPGPVERLAVEFTAFVPGTTALQLFARDAAAAARAGRLRALRAAAREIRLRLRGDGGRGRPMLYHVIEVQPWSRLPERRYALIDFDT